MAATTTAQTSSTTDLDTLGIRSIPEFEGVHDVWPRGQRLEAIRDASHAFRERFKTQGDVLGVRAFEIAAAPYPTRYALGGAAISLNPMISILNRMLVIQYRDFNGQMRTLVWEPTVPAGTIKAPFYAQLEKFAGKYLSHQVFTKYYHRAEDVLPLCGLSNDDVDFASFDHWHVQDMRMILGTDAPIPGESQPCEALFPNAHFVVHRKEIDTLDDPHPMQWAWYVQDGMRGAHREKLAVIDGDVELGEGVAMIWTPGHTDGNHSLAINTPDGVWVSSENGTCLDNWQPELSKIPGVRRYAEFFNREVVMNGNTLEDSLEQYDSMVKEKTIADPSPRDPRWRQVLPSSELVSWKRQWPVVPTFAHGSISYGTLRSPERS